jgi:hypothetical protein
MGGEVARYPFVIHRWILATMENTGFRQHQAGLSKLQLLDSTEYKS